MIRFAKIITVKTRERLASNREASGKSNGVEREAKVNKAASAPEKQAEAIKRKNILISNVIVLF
tara:strand:- start:302 stop:493 length:192 start_codon:yes stop_codon:yes gene_type:complete